MTRMAMIEAHGGPDVIRIVDRDLPPPGPGEVRMRNTAIGLNFIDTYHRSGLYPVPLPSGLGLEAAGVVDAVGEGVTRFAPGARVATFGPALGAYCDARNVAADALFDLPPAITDDVAAAVLLKGATAEFLVERCATLLPGDTVLVHAAAGGVGHLLVQWLNHLGMVVIGTVGSEEKADRARAAGCDHVIFYKKEDVAKRVRALTGGAGVAVAFDGVGASTWEASLASMAPRGLIISYGNASGPVEGVKLAALNQHGSLFVTRPKLFDYYTLPHERADGMARLFAMIEQGVLKVEIGQRLPLDQAAEAHRLIEGGHTIGSTLLIP
ncbi:quinone oxidoreductase [Sphingomonas sp. BGYR3]|uniref:quinone oxidoreductase family protein n=1 Tax=Sphingomonas sp. BGYR3 TaxID=2975483 RepID=UPI0021A8FBC3|nr:quinone oxidoreductase [Sphingomonas sp. BGYR3]MDG5489891.1 quinone oxidoreductase [Sphingomonas sp. BGYR3]